MHLARHPEKTSEICALYRDLRQTIGFVPTMGCLHEGHLSLIKAARERCDRVVVSIFVNPLQFGKNEDFGTYPRPFSRDIQKCEDAGTDLVFHPDPAEFYPRGFSVRVDSGPIGKLYCGKSRPGFFDGILTVVNIFFNLIRPHYAFFGEKDFQQLQLIKQMVRDFRMPIEVVGMPIIREENGLAMSSRNEYLKNEQRDFALCLSQAIAIAKKAYQDGESNGLGLVRMAEKHLRSNAAFALDYAHIVDENSLRSISGDIARPARLLLAGYMGTSPRIRLIDNARINAL